MIADVILREVFSPDKYRRLPDGTSIVPLRVVERLKNEAACISYIKSHTENPVPKLLGEYEVDGSCYLWMERVAGIEMSEFTDKQRCQVLLQGKHCLRPID